MKYTKLVLLGAGVLFSAVSYAGGYEAAIPWGAETAGYAGAAAAQIQGSQALFFNPAGLINDKSTQDVSFNISPEWNKLKAPIADDNAQVQAKSKVVTPLGLMYARNFMPNLAAGVGFYVAGGSSAEYSDVAFTHPTTTVNLKGNLTITEAALGVAYKIMDGLKVGATYRYVMGSADFAFVTRSTSGFTGDSVANVEVNGMKDNKSAFKLGAQWQPAAHTWVGLTYRSEVNFKAKGKFGGKLVTTNLGSFDISDSDATASTTFPQAVQLGVAQDLSDTWRLFAQADWLNYKVDGTLKVEGTVKAGAAGTLASDPELTQNWKDAYVLHLGSEYGGFMLPVRFGFGYGTQIGDPDYERPTNPPAAPGYALTVGTGQKIGDFRWDAAFEYAIQNGDVHGAAAGSTTGDIREGKMTLTQYAIHLGAAYTF